MEGPLRVARTAAPPTRSRMSMGPLGRVTTRQLVPCILTWRANERAMTQFNL
jgi:hypothetical protein